jgi:putative two-component system response regulator
MNITSQVTAERILIVDDTSFSRILISGILSKVGYECVSLPDGEAVLEKLREKDFALVLLDIIMPSKSGVQVLQDVIQEFPDTAVVMLTSLDDAQTAIELLKAGAYDYLIKPVNKKLLVTRVERALERRRLLLENRSHQTYLEAKVKEQAKQIRGSFWNAITSLAIALEAKDKYTRGHSSRVADIAITIARELGFNAQQIEKLRVAALLHDIGKIGIPEALLHKEERLSDDEYSFMVRHSTIGENILKPIIDDRCILNAVRHHHERFDGNGYPDGLSKKYQSTPGL